VLALIQGYPAAVRVETGLQSPLMCSGTPKELNSQILSGFKPEPHAKLQFSGRVVHTAEPHSCELRPLAPIMDLSSDHITIWYIQQVCSFRCSFTFYSWICDSVYIPRVTVKNDQVLAYCHSYCMSINWGANWKSKSESALKTADITYISYLIRSELKNLIWLKFLSSQDLEPAKSPRFLCN